jgi:CO/xanthine dehydrogenase Mo-binding subunit
VPPPPLAAIVVEYEVLEPLTDPERAIDGSHPAIHPDGNVVRHQRIVHGDQAVVGDVIVEGHYELGMQIRRSSGSRRRWRCRTPVAAGSSSTSPRSGCTRTASSLLGALDLPEDKIRLVLAGVGGAFGAREDISLQVHTCLLRVAHRPPGAVCTTTGRRAFLGHVHRHPCKIHMRHHATSDGRIVKVEARMVLDGGRLRVDPRRRC